MDTQEQLDKMAEGRPFAKGPDPRRGRGRPKNPTLEQARIQYEFARRVCYGVNDEDKEAFEQMLHKEMLNRKLHPTVQTLILNYMFGKPIERVEVKDVTNDDFSGLTTEQLRERALEIARNIPPSETRTNEDTSDAIH